MDENTITDLKQFIVQQTTTLRDDLQEYIQTQLDVRLGKLERRLEHKIDALSLAVAEALDASNEATHIQLKNHGLRLTHLEQSTV